MSRYDDAVNETRSVLAEWMTDDRISSEFARGVLAGKIVERLVAKGIIQSTDHDELVAPQHRTGPLQPGRKTVPDRRAEGNFPGSTARDARDGGR